MKKFQVILLMLVLLYSGAMTQSAGEPRYLKPTNFQKKVTTIISEKSRSYYSLSTEEPSIINRQGPGKLRILTRGRFVPDEGQEIKYSIIYIIDGAEQEEVKMSGIERSKAATYLNGSLGVPGQSEDFEIVLGRGYHTIEFKLKDKDIPVALRYKFTPTKAKKQEWIAFSPLPPTKPVDLITREQTVCYYRFSENTPLKVEVIGPTELRVLTRIENHYQMRGRINYRIQVKKNDKVTNTYQLSSRRSDVTYYKDDKELIPGKACEFVIDVPKGKHTYEVLPLDKDKSTVLGRILLPKKDVSLKH